MNPLIEAMLIVDGKSGLLPTREHLQEIVLNLALKDFPAHRIQVIRELPEYKEAAANHEYFHRERIAA